MKRGHLLAPILAFAPFFSSREILAFSEPSPHSYQGELWQDSSSFKVSNPQLFL